MVMNKNQSQTLKMFLLTQKYLGETDATILNSMPGFEDHRTEFNANNSNLESQNKIKTQNFVGYAEDKKNARKAMIALGVDVGNKISAYASENNVTASFKVYKVSEKKLNRFSDSECKEMCILIYNKAMRLSNELIIYNVTSKLLNDFSLSITHFENVLSNLINETKATKLVGSEIVDLFMANTRILAKMDLLVLNVKNTQREFVNGYFESRHIVKAPKHPLAIRFTVVDSNEAAVGHAVIENAALNFHRKTTEKGILIIQSITDGSHSFTISKKGFENKSVNVTCIKGERMDVNVVLKIL